MSRPDMMFHFFCLLSMALIMARRLAEAHMQCGTHDPSSFELKLDQLRTHNFKHSERGRKLIADSCEELCVQCVDIDVYFHLSAIPQTSTSDYILPQPIESVSRFVREDPTLIRGDFSTVAEIYSLIEDNMRVLNERFAESPFSFTWRNSNPINPSVSADLSFAQLDINSIFNDDSVVKELHTGDSTTLNVFLTYAQCSDDADPRTGQITTNCDILGAAVFPSYQQANRDIDGVYVNYSTLTGGGFPQNDEGLTLVHEVGHWLGLYHTFQESASASDPCSPSNENDFVADTPTQAGSSQSLYECSLTHYEGESLPDSCPDLAGSDPVFNYMNYVSDEACWPPGVGEFTCGQYERMYTQWLLYRQHNETCQSNEMEIKIVVEFNRFFQRENVFYLFNDADEVLLNSTRDFDSLLTGIVQDQLLVDFCAPRGTYRLVFLDTLQDGFEEGGAYEIYVDGSLVDRVVGDFGRSSVTEFGPPDAIDAPSRIPSRAEATAPTVSPVFLSPTLMPTNLPSIAPVLLSSAAPSTSPTKNPGGTVTEIPIAGEIGATSIPTPTSPHVPKVASITSVPIGLSHTEPELPSGVRNKWHFCTLVLSVLVLIPIPYL